MIAVGCFCIVHMRTDVNVVVIIRYPGINGGHRAGLSGFGSREKDPGEDSFHPGQHPAFSAQNSSLRVHLQAAVSDLLHKQTQELFCPPWHQTGHWVVRGGHSHDHSGTDPSRLWNFCATYAVRHSCFSCCLLNHLRSLWITLNHCALRRVNAAHWLLMHSELKVFCLCRFYSVLCPNFSCQCVY